MHYAWQAWLQAPWSHSFRACGALLNPAATHTGKEGLSSEENAGTGAGHVLSLEAPTSAVRPQACSQLRPLLSPSVDGPQAGGLSLDQHSSGHTPCVKARALLGTREAGLGTSGCLAS